MNLGFERPEAYYDGEGNKFSFHIKPLERGFGETIGLMFRRTLLTSMPGTAIVGIKIDGVVQEMQMVDGTIDDLIDIVLNLKQMRFAITNDTEEVVKIVFKGNEGKQYFAKDISLPSNIEVLTPDVPFLTCTGEKEVEVELFLKKGRGFVLASKCNDFDSGSGILAIDGKFNPVIRVSHPVVKDYRIGEDTDYDSVSFDVETDGSISPKEAISLSVNIVKSYLDFVDNSEHANKKLEIYKKQIEEQNQLLEKEIEQLGMSIRSQKRLKLNNVNKVKDLVELTETDISSYPQIGKVSRKEILDTIKELRMQLNID
ncbi:DNA-directed RNA polymerase subunit alpha [Bacillus cereus]|uniref:DNA-directed RNA polymerase subunit alpha n=1 Tax=Bacillus cereus TaxID=1396 RepID=A0A164QQM6_BACCE|nr:DNA-directed RNA polymerase subunit alpha [Bacillus cereus]KZD72042.1 DNA-directed RNA polymerase alpha subunit [Bacillus cereus]HDR8321551.1 DNA-directed RNA polymerase subunit alpha [Bacillus cereus]HDR8329255.1 DNA-directed RNA polymerase subunit alpha [Bacillus cereus]HDR8333048.1 DNA-directed RNA polymerase subunit alpha [Bacillus cereus]